MTTGYISIPLLVLLAGSASTPKPTADPTNQSAPAAAQPENRQLEKLGNVYVPNVPAGQQPQTSPATIIEQNGFFSIQVNVDGAGNNILGDAANEPSIAVDPTDGSRIVIGWRQFDSVTSNFRQAGWGYTANGGSSWTFPGVIEPGVFRSDPVLDSDHTGTFFYNSLTLVGGSVLSIDVFRSTDGGVTWDGGAPAFGGDKQWMTVDRSGGMGDGQIYSNWNNSFSCCGGDFTHSTDGGSTYLGPLLLPSGPRWGTMSVDPDGNLYISGLPNFGGGFIVMKSTNAQDAGQTPAFPQVVNVDLTGTLSFGTGPNPGGLAGQAWVATDHSSGPSRGNVYLLASVDPPGADPLDVMFSRSTDGGLTWSPAMRVNDDASTSAWQWFGTMSVAPNGRIDVVFNDTRNTGLENMSEMFYTFSTDTGITWSPNVSVAPVFNSHLGWPDQSKIGDYYDMVSDNAGANLAFSATFNGEQDVYFMRLGTDCNGNGVSDLQDIADGTSSDDDANGVPDECAGDVIPTVSHWGVAVMMLLALAAGSAAFRRAFVTSR